ncbi:hypothetical protein [Streptomyces aureocirculatus]|uniref:hypothetical protein n=1 Tax=Streptomyces aureocirculatus TaxID=67275 RepID=UPI0004C942FF|nr:hypothetical protein [Streptomyces aureocirculatus]
MQHGTRSARLAASLLSAVVAVLAFAVPSRAATTATAGPTAAHTWAAATADRHSGAAPTTGAPGGQRQTAHGPHTSYGKDGHRAVHATAAHPLLLQIPHPPGPGTAGTGAHHVPHRSLGGPDARLHLTTPSTRFADAAPEPRGPPFRRS